MSISLIRRDRGRLAQVALEFSLFVILSFMILGAFLFAIRGRLTELSSERDAKEINDLANRLREEIFLASIVQDGYSREFTLPEKLNSKVYTIEISDGHVIGTLGAHSYTTPAPTVIGTPTTGTNVINKTGGVIYLN